ncbi:cystathionine gamma-synthase [Malaciobacter molluscorum LMG 25693]|uniref:Cys/Met metabolism PLP-dependent enzyme n=1 Tax=Malaciobacter molluscorum LMG 25693 TaxID=870501 RepID=A0A2G1DFZ8_9BACT|nr:PLP-dependent transferase [Malaciobacter molluscorum]AXX91700.1 Cys/Met metabolism PLP-dependent enzyme [Malaciobacter molluscorum LMG 25693]PHO17411.1 cystathionine gamma-synthase [Malaciobacter molluscorum LMG 25693]
MKKEVFKHIACGETLPIKNIHAVSVSMPTLQDVIDYEEHTPEILEKIKSAYPRFILHPYLKILAKYIKEKYSVCDNYEVVLLSSQEAVKIVSDKYFIYNKIDIDEPFGVILVIKGTTQLQKVLTFIQHVGCNLSSRFAQDYLYKVKIIDTIHKEELEDEKTATFTLKNTLAKAYNQPIENIGLAPSGMNAIYSVVRGLKKIQEKSNRTILVQLGWLYLDTMNIVEHHYDRTKKFLDISNLDIVEEFLEKNGLNVSAIITEIPTNPLIQSVDVKRLRQLCDKYNIPLVIDATLATPYNLNLKPYADILVESLTKFACGNADVLMGAVILNENFKISHMQGEFFKHLDMVYIKDIQRLAYEIKGYEKRVKKISANTKKLIKYFKQNPLIDRIYYCCNEENKKNYEIAMIDDNSYSGLISVTFKKDFRKIYDNLNFAKGPSLGTEFTLLMPYVYLAHYDYISCKKGQEFLKKINLPIDLLRISVGTENIEDIINEFKRVESLIS